MQRAELVSLIMRNNECDHQTAEALLEKNIEQGLWEVNAETGDISIAERGMLLSKQVVLKDIEALQHMFDYAQEELARAGASEDVLDVVTDLKSAALAAVAWRDRGLQRIANVIVTTGLLASLNNPNLTNMCALITKIIRETTEVTSDFDLDAIFSEKSSN